MKFLFALALTSLTASAFAVEFSAKFENIDCKIANGTVTRTIALMKNTEATLTETKSVKLENADQLVQKAIDSASVRPSRDSVYVFTMTNEGKTYYLNSEDSREAMALMKMLAEVCR
jgi:hypothetical protein